MNNILPNFPSIQSMLINIPGGTVELRDDRIKKQWRVEVSPFWLSKFPVTQAFYLEIIQENPSTFIGNELPVETVSWKEAAIFCNILSDKNNLLPCYHFPKGMEVIEFNRQANGFRMPTEAEWQYACMAGKTGTRYGELDEIAWYKHNSAGKTQEVGKKKPNEWGLFDMLGNVWEWCSDIYDETTYRTYRIIKGGGWNDEPRGCLATNRRRSHPISYKIDDLGFRICKNE